MTPTDNRLCYLPTYPLELRATLQRGYGEWWHRASKRRTGVLEEIFSSFIHNTPLAQQLLDSLDLRCRLWRRYVRLEYRLKPLVPDEKVHDYLETAYAKFRNIRDTSHSTCTILNHHYKRLHLDRGEGQSFLLLCLKRLQTRSSMVLENWIALDLFTLKLRVTQMVKKEASQEHSYARVCNFYWHNHLAKEPHIAKVINGFSNYRDYGSIYIFKYYNIGDLLDFCSHYVSEKDAAKLDERSRLCLMQAVIHQIHRLYEKGICHRDLKLENFLLTDSEKKGFKLALTDFEFANDKLDEIWEKRINQNNRACGTFALFPPELLWRYKNNSLASVEELMHSSSWFVGHILRWLWHSFLPEELGNWIDEGINVLDGCYQKVNKSVFFAPAHVQEGIDYYSNITAYDALEGLCKTNIDRLIWSMRHPDPKKRPNMTDVVATFSRIFQGSDHSDSGVDGGSVDQTRPEGKERADSRPTASISCDTLGTCGDESGDLLGESLEDGGVRISNSDSENAFIENVLWSGAGDGCTITKTFHMVAGGTAADSSESFNEHLPTSVSLQSSLWAEDGKVRLPPEAVAVGSADLQLVRRRAASRP